MSSYKLLRALPDNSVKSHPNSVIIDFYHITCQTSIWHFIIYPYFLLLTPISPIFYTWMPFKQKSNSLFLSQAQYQLIKYTLIHFFVIICRCSRIHICARQNINLHFLIRYFIFIYWVYEHCVFVCTYEMYSHYPECEWK